MVEHLRMPTEQGLCMGVWYRTHRNPKQIWRQIKGQLNEQLADIYVAQRWFVVVICGARVMCDLLRLGILSEIISHRTHILDIPYPKTDPLAKEV